MRNAIGHCAAVLGVVGVVTCVGVVGIGWWVATRTAARVDRAAIRVDGGLCAIEQKLASIEARLNAVRTDINAVLTDAESIASGNPDLSRMQAQIERLLDRSVQIFDRADTIAASLGSVAVGLRTGADVVDQFDDDSELTVRARNAADTIDRAAESLASLRTKVEAWKSVKTVQLSQEFVTFAREGAAGAERLTEGLTLTRQSIVVARERMDTLRDDVVFWIHIAATAFSLIALWIGVGQLCLFSWGRRN
ncbi:MAG: hypothetical protein ACJ8C4_00910 [Gemmataceae bacterium]